MQFVILGKNYVGYDVYLFGILLCRTMYYRFSEFPRNDTDMWVRNLEAQRGVPFQTNINHVHMCLNFGAKILVYLY